jgi:hypothetical protein
VPGRAGKWQLDWKRWDTALKSCDTSWDGSRALDPVSH